MYISVRCICMGVWVTVHIELILSSTERLIPWHDVYVLSTYLVLFFLCGYYYSLFSLELVVQYHEGGAEDEDAAARASSAAGRKRARKSKRVSASSSASSSGGSSSRRSRRGRQEKREEEEEEDEGTMSTGECESNIEANSKAGSTRRKGKVRRADY